MKSTNRKNQIIIFLCIAVFFVYWLWNVKKVSKNSEATENSTEVLTEEELKQNSEKQKLNTESNVNIPTHHSDVEKKKEADFVQGEKVLFEKEQVEHRQVTQMPVSDKEIKEFLDSKGGINPENEFRDLPDFNYDQGKAEKYLQGLYIDKTVNLTIAIIYKNREGDLDDLTCVRIKNDPIYRFSKRELEIRSSGNGYIVIMLGHEWYLRLFVNSLDGVVTGKLFQRLADGWQFVDSIVVSPRRPAFEKISPNGSICTLTDL